MSGHEWSGCGGRFLNVFLLAASGDMGRFLSLSRPTLSSLFSSQLADVRKESEETTSAKLTLNLG